MKKSILNSFGVMNYNRGLKALHLAEFMKNTSLTKEVNYSVMRDLWLATRDRYHNTNMCEVNIGVDLVTDKIRITKYVSVVAAWDEVNNQLLCWISPKKDAGDIDNGYLFVMDKEEFGRDINLLGSGSEDREAIAANNKYRKILTKVAFNVLSEVIPIIRCEFHPIFPSPYEVIFKEVKDNTSNKEVPERRKTSAISLCNNFTEIAKLGASVSVNE